MATMLPLPVRDALKEVPGAGTRWELDSTMHELGSPSNQLWRTAGDLVGSFMALGGRGGTWGGREPRTMGTAMFSRIGWTRDVFIGARRHRVRALTFEPRHNLAPFVCEDPPALRNSELWFRPGEMVEGTRAGFDFNVLRRLPRIDLFAVAPSRKQQARATQLYGHVKQVRATQCEPWRDNQLGTVEMHSLIYEVLEPSAAFESSYRRTRTRLMFIYLPVIKSGPLLTASAVVHFVPAEVEAWWWQTRLLVGLLLATLLYVEGPDDTVVRVEGRFQWRCYVVALDEEGVPTGARRLAWVEAAMQLTRSYFAVRIRWFRKFGVRVILALNELGFDARLIVRGRGNHSRIARTPWYGLKTRSLALPGAEPEILINPSRSGRSLEQFLAGCERDPGAASYSQAALRRTTPQRVPPDVSPKPALQKWEILERGNFSPDAPVVVRVELPTALVGT